MTRLSKLTSAKDRVKGNCAMIVLNMLAHSSFSYWRWKKLKIRTLFLFANQVERKTRYATDRPPTKDLHRISSSLLCCLSSMHLQKPNLPSEQIALLRVVHMTHLIRHVFEPVLYGFDAADHACELGADDGLFDEGFTEYATLGCPSGRVSEFMRRKNMAMRQGGKKSKG